MLLGADGERNLTDLEHLAELLSAETHTGGHGRGGTTAAAAAAVLDDLGGTAVDEVAGDAVQRRIESEADAVQVTTIHASKGLEFPVVLLPELWSPGPRVQAGDVLSYFDQDEQRRVLDVSTAQPATDEATGRSKRDVAPIAYDETRRQNCGDQHRLTYVALTRAVHHAAVWWTRCGTGNNLAGLTRMLAGVANTDHPADVAAQVPQGPGVGRRAPRAVPVDPGAPGDRRWRRPSDPHSSWTGRPPGRPPS